MTRRMETLAGAVLMVLGALAVYAVILAGR